MLIEDAIKKVILEETTVLIPCLNKGHQESIRTMAFHMRKKLKEKFSIVEDIGISKYSHGDQLFIRVYKREVSELYEFDPVTGEPVPVKKTFDPEVIRMVELMRKDGKSEEEILEALKEMTE
jgi:hypothetical protein